MQNNLGYDGWPFLNFVIPGDGIYRIDSCKINWAMVGAQHR